MKNKIFLFLLIMIFVYATGGIIYVKLNMDNFNKPLINNIDEIDKFDYFLKSNSTEIYKQEYDNLKNILTSDDINYEEYAKSISKLFIIDLYSIEAKINKYDVGGVDFIQDNFKENYKLNVEDTLYKYLEDNSNNNRKQTLPNVKSVNIISVVDNKFKVDKEEYPAYKVSLDWEYDVDLGYDSKGEINLIKDNNKLYIVSFEPINKEA